MKTKSKQKQKQKIPPKNLKSKSIEKNTSKKKLTNKSDTNSNSSSIDKSLKKSKSKKKSHSKDNSKSKEEPEKQINIDNELIKKQYKIVKDFLTPILKEENARQLVLCYSKKIEKEKNQKDKKNNKISSLNTRTILDYSFVNKNSKNKMNIPLFQILFPNQYKKHFNNNKGRNINQKNKPNRHLSVPNINITNHKQVKKRNNSYKKNKNNINLNKIKNRLNIKKKEINKNKEINNNKDKSITSSNNNNNRAKTPPLYLRLNDVQKKHEKEMEELKKKYEYNYNNSSSNSVTPSESESFYSRNKSHSTYDFKKWYNYEKTWEKMRNIKLNMIKNEIEENKMFINRNEKNEETFKPRINKNSEIIVNEKYEGNDFYSRLKKYQEKKNKKKLMLQKKLEPSFKPYVNTNYIITGEYYDYMRFNQRLINRDLKYFLE